MKSKIYSISILTIITFTVYAQNGKYGETVEDSIKCLESHTLYKDPHFIRGNYDEAIPYWRDAYRICPKSSKNLYINGIKMYKKFYKEAKDINTKNAISDTIMMIYDQRMLYFGQEGVVLGKKGGDLLKMRSDKTVEANEMLQKSFELQQKNMERNALIYYYQSYYELVRQKKIERKVLIEKYPEVIEIADYNIENAVTQYKKESWNKARATIDKMMILVATCDDLIAYFNPRFIANPEDTVLLKSLIKYLGKLEDKGCTEQILYYEASVKLCSISPSYDCAISLGNYLAKKNKFSIAVTHYQSATKLARTNDEKIESNMKAAKCYYNLKQYSNVRANCYKIIAINPNYGEAYLLIGDAYASSSEMCKGTDARCTQKAVFWVAYDKYEKAKFIDAAISGKANKKMASASSRFPNIEDCFYKELYNGDSFTLDCWINETTKVRFKQ